MTNEERDVITRFIERVGGASSGGSGSVPSSRPLPPVDHEADALIADLFQKNPEARYRITQLAYVQEQALNAAQQRIQALQAQLQQTQQQQSQGGSPWGGAAPSGGQPQHRGLLSSLFGGGGSQASSPPPQYQPPPPAPPQYAPPQAMMQPQGSGFLGGALRTAAGVAGGLVAGEALMNLFEGNRGGFGGGGGFGGSEVVPGGFVPAAAESPWLGGGQSGAGPDPYDQGGLPKDDAASDPFAAAPPAADTSGWAPAPDQGGLQDASADPGVDPGGWQDAQTASSSWDTGSNSDDGGWTDSSSDA